jgi:hypothetical protein
VMGQSRALRRKAHFSDRHHIVTVETSIGWRPSKSVVAQT